MEYSELKRIADEIWNEVEHYLPDVNGIIDNSREFMEMYQSGKEFTQIKFYFRTPDEKVVDMQLLSFPHEEAYDILNEIYEFNRILEEATRRYIREYFKYETERNNYMSSFRPCSDVGFCYVWSYTRVLGDSDD